MSDRSILTDAKAVRTAIVDDYMGFRRKDVDEKDALVSARMSYAATNAVRGEIAARRFENGVKMAAAG